VNVLRIVLADDQVMIRRGLRALLTAEPDLEVVAEAGNGQQALAAARAHRPDVIVLLAPQAARRLVMAFAAAPAPTGPAARALDLLTPREREVVALVARGLSNEEIADRLVISPATSRTHVSRAMVKLTARDRAQLVVFAYESGLVHPGRTG
jgi:DNA-binding NarL/FixJ family response regulator